MTSPPPLVPVLKTCPMCRENFAPRRLVGRPSMVRGRVVGIIFCSKPCAERFDREIGGNPILHDFALPSARPDRRCAACETPLAPSDPLERCRMCRLTERIRARLRKEAKRSAKFRALRDAHLVYVRRYGAVPMEEITY